MTQAVAGARSAPLQPLLATRRIPAADAAPSCAGCGSGGALLAGAAAGSQRGGRAEALSSEPPRAARHACDREEPLCDQLYAHRTRLSLLLCFCILSAALALSVDAEALAASADARPGAGVQGEVLFMARLADASCGTVLLLLFAGRLARAPGLLRSLLRRLLSSEVRAFPHQWGAIARAESTLNLRAGQSQARVCVGGALGGDARAASVENTSAGTAGRDSAAAMLRPGGAFVLRGRGLHLGSTPGRTRDADPD